MQRIFRFFLLCAFGCSIAQDDSEQGDFEFQDSVLGVVLEGNDSQQQGLRFIITEAKISAQADFLVHGNLSIEFVASNEAMHLPGDIGGVMSVGGCDMTWRLQETMQEGDAYQAALITEPGCLRLRSSMSMSIAAIPSQAYLNQIILDMRQDGALHWKDVCLFVDDSVGTEEIHQLISAVTQPVRDDDSGTAISLFRVPGRYKSQYDNYLRDTLSSFTRRPEGLRFMTVLRDETTANFLLAARLHGFLGPSYQWFIVLGDDPDAESRLVQLLHDGDNVCFLQKDPERDGSADRVCSTQSKLEEQVKSHSRTLIEAVTKGLEKTVNEELNLWNEFPEDEWDQVRPSWAQHSADIITATKDALESIEVTCDRWTFRTIEGGNPDLLVAGWWSPMTGTRMRDQTFPNVQGGMRGRVLKVGSFHIVEVDEFGRVIYSSGLVFRILDELSVRMNFSYEVMVPEDGSLWGYEDSDGVWTGVLGQLQRNEVSLAAVAFPVYNDNSSTILDFTTVFASRRYAFLVKAPGHLGRLLLFLQPYSTLAWLAILAAVALVGPILYLFSMRVIPAIKPGDPSLSSFFLCCWYVMGAALQQGGATVRSPGGAARCVAGAWWATTLVTTTLYSGSLVALLSQRKPASLDSGLMKHLLSMPGTQQSVFSISYTYPPLGLLRSSPFVNRSGLEMYPTSIQEAVVLDHGEEDMLKTLEMIRDEKMVVMDSRERFRGFLADSVLCNVRLAGPYDFLEEQVALAVPKDSPHLSRFNSELIQLVRSGLVAKWKSETWPAKRTCYVEAAARSKRANTSGAKSVGLEDLAGTFCLLLLGLCLAALMYGMEVWRKRREKAARRIVALSFRKKAPYPFLE